MDFPFTDHKDTRGWSYVIHRRDRTSCSFHRSRQDIEGVRPSSPPLPSSSLSPTSLPFLFLLPTLLERKPPNFLFPTPFFVLLCFFEGSLLFSTPYKNPSIFFLKKNSSLLNLNPPFQNHNFKTSLLKPLFLRPSLF